MYSAFSARTTNGTSDRIVCFGGYGTFKVSGTFDGCTVTLKGAETGGTLVSLGSDVELTAAGIVDFALWTKGGTEVMDLAVEITNAGASTSIDALIGLEHRSQ